MSNTEAESNYIIPDQPETLFGTRVNGVFTVTGIVHMIRDESELPFFREGEILVAEKIDPSWAEQLSLAKALIEASRDDADDTKDVCAIAEQYDLPAENPLENPPSGEPGKLDVLPGVDDVGVIQLNRSLECGV